MIIARCHTCGTMFKNESANELINEIIENGGSFEDGIFYCPDCGDEMDIPKEIMPD